MFSPVSSTEAAVVQGFALEFISFLSFIFCSYFDWPHLFAPMGSICCYSSLTQIPKKTPFQKHSEEEEARKKREEDETSRLYAKFVELFQGDSAPGSQAFVQGGTINPNERLKVDSEGEKCKEGITDLKKGSS